MDADSPRPELINRILYDSLPSALDGEEEKPSEEEEENYPSKYVRLLRGGHELYVNVNFVTFLTICCRCVAYDDGRGARAV